MSLSAPRRFLLLALLATAALALIQGDCVQEDAFISFRYADNLVHGHGLVFNPGERVEGYTNFLWTVTLAGAMALGLDPEPVARTMGLLAALALLVAVYRLARRLFPDRPGAAALAPLLLAATPGFAAEAVQGLETTTFALLVTLGVGAAVDALESGDAPRAVRPSVLAGLLLALAALTRPEGVGVVGLVAIGGLLSTRGRSAARTFAAGALVFLAIYLPYWWFRFDWYGHPLPNTFYAKTGGGLRHLWRGLGYLGRFLLGHPAVTALSGVAVWSLRGRRPSRPRPATAVPLTVVLGYLIYVAVVGGDFKATWRFVLPVLPLWTLLLGAWAGAALDRVRWAAWALIGLAVLNAAPTLPGTLRWSRQRARDLEQRLVCGEWLRDHARPDALLAIHSVGIVPYVSGLRTVDMWGLNDLHIAHRRMPDMGRVHAAGHEKHDYAYVLARNPDYILPRGWVMVTGTPYDGLAAAVFHDFVDCELPDGIYAERSVPLPPAPDGSPRWFNFLERTGTGAISSPPSR